MKKKTRSLSYDKKYTATWDNGHDTGQFFYYSSHRAGSKQNLENAISELVKKHGQNARHRKITDIRRTDEV